MFLRLTTSTLALALVTSPALALTPEELWTTWSAYYARSGYVVAEGARDLAGETLTLKDVTLTQEAVPGDKLVITLPELVMTGSGDGGVRSSFGPGMKIDLDTKNAEGESVVVHASVKMDGAEIVSQGDASAHTDTLTAPSLVATLDSIDLPDDPDLTNVGSLTITDLTGTSSFKGTGTQVDTTSKAGKIEYAVNVAETDKSLVASGSFDGFEATGALVTTPEGKMDFGKEMSAALRAGASLTGTAKMGANTHKADITGKDDEGKPTSGTFAVAVGPADVTFSIDEAGIAYQGAVTALDTRLEATELPVPIAYKLDEATFDIQMPVLGSDTPQPMKFAYALTGLSMDEAIWGLFDPSRQLPRDPASLEIDVTGKVRLTADLFDPAWIEAAADGDAEDDVDAAAPAPDAAPTPAADPAATPTADATPTPAEATATPADATATPAAEATPSPAADAAATDAAPTPAADPAATPAAGDTTATPAADGAADAVPTPADAAEDDDAPMPFEVTELTINRFALSAAGVKADAKGALTVPEGGSIDAPVGTVNATIEGANGLIDKLVAMGLVSQDEVTGYRMMLTMFTKAGEGTDTLTSDVEFKEGGEVIVNGQKVK